MWGFFLTLLVFKPTSYLLKFIVLQLVHDPLFVPPMHKLKIWATFIPHATSGLLYFMSEGAQKKHSSPMPNNFRKHMAVGVEIVLCSKHTCGKIKVHPVHSQCRNFWKNYTDLPKSDRPKLFMTKHTYIAWKTLQDPQLNEILPTTRAWRTHGNISSSVTFCQVDDSCIWPIIFSLQLDSITIAILRASWRIHVFDIGKYLVPAAMASIKSMYHGSVSLLTWMIEQFSLVSHFFVCLSLKFFVFAQKLTKDTSDQEHI